MKSRSLIYTRPFRLAIAFLVSSLCWSTFASIVNAQLTGTTVPSRSGATTDSHPLDPALRVAQASLQHVRENLTDYTALFVKRCRVDGVLPDLQYANVKIRNRKVVDRRLVTPMSVYLNFLKPEEVQGREVIWIEGQNDGKIIAHETGLKGMINVYLDPNGYLAMRGQKRPITDIGIENLLVEMLEIGMRDRQHQECEVQFFKNAKIGDRVCTMIQVVHPVPRSHFEFHRARLYFDDELNLPIRYASWSWPQQAGGEPILEEEYTYLNVEPNVGLTAKDFDLSNPAYNFR